MHLNLGLRDPDMSGRSAVSREVVMGPKGKIRSIMSILSPREFVVVQLHYRTGLTQKRIGDELGLSQQSVSTILGDAMDRLRNAGNFVVDFDPEDN